MNDILQPDVWPLKGDSLFNIGLDWESGAILGGSPQDLFFYAQAYKEAADRVVEAIEASRQSGDLLVYPVFFLYRHSIELSLKALIATGRTLQREVSGYPKHHHIDQLWAECQKILEQAFPEADEADTDTVEHCIREAASLDPSGEHARYPKTKSGQDSLPVATQLDMRNVRDVMRRMEGFLSGSYDALYELLQYQADMDSEAL
jgi:hypothetical protein